LLSFIAEQNQCKYCTFSKTTSR